MKKSRAIRRPGTRGISPFITASVLVAAGLAQAQTLATYTFTSGPTEAPTFTGGTASSFQYGAGLTANTASGAFNSQGYTGEATDYVFFNLTASSGSYLRLTNLSFQDQRSSTGPATGTASVYTSGGTALQTSASYTNPTAIAAIAPFDFTDIITDAVQFRLAGASASASGTLRYDNVAIGGAAAAQTAAVALTANTRFVSDNSTMNFAGVISGASIAIEKLGSGTITFSGAGANTYNGVTSVSSGTLALAKTAGVNAIAGNVTVGDNTTTAGLDILQLNADNQIADTATVTIAGTSANAGIFRLNGNDETVAGLVSAAAGSGIVENNAAALSILTVNNAVANSFSGLIRDGSTGKLSLVKSGAGTLTLGGANTYTGATTVNSGGTLAFAGSGNLSTTTALTANGTFDISGAGATPSTAATVTVGSLAGSGTVTLADSKTLSVGGDNTSTTFSGTITTTASSGALTKTGTGTLTLSGNNSYKGLTTVSGGTLRLGAAGNGTNSPLGTSGNGATVSSGAALDLNGIDLSIGELLTVNGTGATSSPAGALTNSSSTAATYTGSVSLSTASAIGGVGDIQLNGTTSGNALTYAGSATLILNGSTNSTTTTTINSGGTLQVGTGGTTGKFGSGAVTNNGAVVFNRDAGTVVTVSNAIGGSGTVTFDAGAITLTGDNAYTGATAINGSTVVTAASATGRALGGTTKISISNSGTLLLGADNQLKAGATVALADSATLATGHFSQDTTNRLGALTLSGTASIDFGTGAGTSILAFDDSSGQAWSGTLSIYNYTGTGTEKLFFGDGSTMGLQQSQLDGISFYSGAMGTDTFLGTGGFVEGGAGELGIAAVPEPAPVIGVLLVVGLLGWKQRRQLRGLAGAMRRAVTA